MPNTSDLVPLDAMGWLAQQPPAFRHWAAGAGRWRRYQRGQVLYDAGDPSDGLYGLAEGALDITFPLVAEAMLAEQPERWRAFYLLSHLNAVTAVNLLAEVLALSVTARVAPRLLRLADPDGVVNVTQDDLAKLVGVARATLQRAFDELAKADAIKTGYRSVTIADREVLERYVSQQ